MSTDAGKGKFEGKSVRDGRTGIGAKEHRRSKIDQPSVIFAICKYEGILHLSSIEKVAANLKRRIVVLNKEWNMEWVFWGLTIVSSGLVLFLLKIAITIWWKPLQLKKYFEAQGIRGPPYKLFHGNSQDVSRMIDEQREKPMPALSHDILPRVVPHIYQWTKTYGTLVFSMSSRYLVLC